MNEDKIYIMYIETLTFSHFIQCIFKNKDKVRNPEYFIILRF